MGSSIHVQDTAVTLLSWNESCRSCGGTVNK